MLNRKNTTRLNLMRLESRDVPAGLMGPTKFVINYLPPDAGQLDPVEQTDKRPASSQAATQASTTRPPEYDLSAMSESILKVKPENVKYLPQFIVEPANDN